jgi:RimJ/RimL family protein N-acetyltransferase
MRIRDVVPEDAAKLVQLRQSLSAETDFMLHGTGEYNSTEQEVASQIVRASQLPTSRSLVAEQDDTFVGFLAVMGSSVPRTRHAAYLALGVLRTWWGRGVATDMLKQVLRWAPTVGVSRLELSVMTTNTRAITLYERLGFKFEGLRHRAYMINGVAIDDHLMGYVFDVTVPGKPSDSIAPGTLNSKQSGLKK